MDSRRIAGIVQASFYQWTKSLPLSGNRKDYKQTSYKLSMLVIPKHLVWNWRWMEAKTVVAFWVRFAWISQNFSFCTLLIGTVKLSPSKDILNQLKIHQRICIVLFITCNLCHFDTDHRLCQCCCTRLQCNRVPFCTLKRVKGHHCFGMYWLKPETLPWSSVHAASRFSSPCFKHFWSWFEQNSPLKQSKSELQERRLSTSGSDSCSFGWSFSSL